MFPLPPREAALLAEFIRVFDARLVTEGGGASNALGNEAWASGQNPGLHPPSVTEPLFPNEERAA